MMRDSYGLSSLLVTLPPRCCQLYLTNYQNYSVEMHTTRLIYSRCERGRDDLRRKLTLSLLIFNKKFPWIAVPQALKLQGLHKKGHLYLIQMFQNGQRHIQSFIGMCVPYCIKQTCREHFFWQMKLPIACLTSIWFFDRTMCHRVRQTAC